MILADIGRALVIASIPLLASLDLLSVVWIYVVGFVSSTLAIGFDAGQYAAIPSLVGADNLVAANGRVQASYAAAGVAGPLLAGLLVALAPLQAVLYVDALSFLISAGSLRLVKSSFGQATRTEPSSIRASIKEGLRYELSHPLLRNISLMLVLVNFTIAPIQAQLVYFAKTQLAASDSQWAWFGAAGGAGIIALSLLASSLRRHFSFSKVASITLSLYGLLAIALALTHLYSLALLLWALMNGLGMLFDISVISLRQQVVPDAMLGRVMISATVLVEATTPLGSFVGGLLVDATHNVALIYAVSGVLTAIIPMLFIASLGRAERNYVRE